MKALVLALLVLFAVVQAQQPTAVAIGSDSVKIVSVEMFGVDYPCVRVIYKIESESDRLWNTATYFRDYYFPDSGYFTKGFKWVKKYSDRGEIIKKEHKITIVKTIPDSVEWEIVGREK